tara:strand:+ start:157 stop:261 length:105 start_codon:yes stop_codon:yes gene_type:complete
MCGEFMAKMDDGDWMIVRICEELIKYGCPERRNG